MSLHNPFIKVLLSLLSIIVVWAVTKYRFHYSFKEDQQLRKPIYSQLLLWLAIDLLWMFGTDYFMNWRGAWDFAPWIAQPLYVSVLRVTAVCFLGPIAEELIFRGLFFKRLLSLKMNLWLAMVLLSIAWALMHYSYSPAVIFIIFIQGLFLGSACIRSKSIVAPIIMHICWNLYAIW